MVILRNSLNTSTQDEDEDEENEMAAEFERNLNQLENDGLVDTEKDDEIDATVLPKGKNAGHDNIIEMHDRKSQGRRFR